MSTPVNRKKYRKVKRWSFMGHDVKLGNKNVGTESSHKHESIVSVIIHLITFEICFDANATGFLKLFLWGLNK